MPPMHFPAGRSGSLSRIRRATASTLSPACLVRSWARAWASRSWSTIAAEQAACFAPAKTPASILTRLHDAAAAALALPEVRDRLREQGAEVVGGSSTELAAYVAAEIPKWAALARQAGVKPE